ncbi:MAG: tetratricopeptide repeat protein [Sandaracinus sp.]
MHELGRGWAALALALAFAVSGWSASARAQESDDDAARRHFRLGQAHYENGEFAEAATEFDEAYRLSQRPQLLYNVYVAYRDSGDMPHAAHALRLYLDLVPDAENASQLRARLTAMERVLASQTTTTTTTSTDTSTDTSTPGDTTTTTTDTSTDTTTPSDTTTSTSDTTTDTTPPAASGGGGFGSSPVGWIVAGVGVAAIVGGIITGAMALDAQSTLDNQCGPDRRSCPAGFESTRNTGQALGAATDGLLIGGGVLVATGVVLLFVLDGGSSEPSPVSAACDGTGCAAFVSGTF